MAVDLDILTRFLPDLRPGQAKHARLSQALLSAIDAGHWSPGTKLPTEQELANGTDFSLGTVQRALRSLVDSGVIVRRQGAGSFVAAREATRDDPWHLRFYADDGISFLPVRPKVVFRDRFAAPGPWVAPLGIGPREEVVQVDRQIDIGGEFTVFSRFFATAEPYGSLLYRPLAELDAVNFGSLLRAELGVVIASITKDVMTAELPTAVCATLSLDAGAVGLYLQIVARTADADAVYYQELFVPPTDRRLHISDDAAGAIE